MILSDEIAILVEPAIKIGDSEPEDDDIPEEDCINDKCY